MAGTEHSSRASVVGQPTTLMFRHVPRKYTTRDLLAALMQHVTSAAFDFVYVPWDKKSTNNMGFAFVNFVDGQVARMITAMMDGSIWPKDSRRREMKIVPAILQGLVNNLRRYRENVKEHDPARCPLLFHKGQAISVNLAFRLFLRPQAWVTGNAQASSAGSGRTATGPTSLAWARPPHPEGLAGTRAAVSGTGWPDRPPNVIISHGSPPGLNPGSALMFHDQYQDGHRTAQLLEQAPARFEGVGAHAVGDGFFEDVAPASTSTASTGAAEAEESASSRRDAVRRTPAYASAWYEVNFLLGQLKQTGAF